MPDPHTFGHFTPAQQANRLYALADRRDVLAAAAQTPAERDQHEIAAAFSRMAAERCERRAGRG